MNIYDLTPNELKRAAAIKEQIDRLNKQRRVMFDAPANFPATPKKNPNMSASTKKKIAAAQKARWANLRRAKSAKRSVKPAARKKRMSPAARAKLSTKLKAYWAAKKAGKKK